MKPKSVRLGTFLLCFVKYLLLIVSSYSGRSNGTTEGLIVETTTDLFMEISESSDIHDVRYIENKMPMRLSLKVGLKVVINLKMYQREKSPSFVIFQAHAQWLNLTASMDAIAVPSRVVTGRNIGLVSVIGAGDAAVWYLLALNNVDVLVMAVIYYDADPIPGGLDLATSFRNNPNMNLYDLPHRSVLEFQRGECVSNETQSRQAHVSGYEVYQMFLNERDITEEHFFAVMKKMMLTDDIKSYATKITSLQWFENPQLNFASYIGQGVAYNVIVNNRNLSSMLSSQEAAYVPFITYSCDLPRDQCIREGSLLRKVVAVTYGVFGLFICFIGHGYFKFEMFFFGSLATALTVFILLRRLLPLTFSVSLYIALGVSVLGGVIWMFLWVFIRRPRLSVSLLGCLLGYLVASVIFNATPLNINKFFQSELNYQMLMLVFILVTPALILRYPRILSVLSCTVIGSYLVMLAFDVFLSGTMQNILLNSILKSSDASFVAAFTAIPFQLWDQWLCGIWVAMTLLGLLNQYVRERNQPPFPVSPVSHPASDGRSGAATEEGGQSPFSVNSRPTFARRDAEERQPLLVGRTLRGASRRPSPRVEVQVLRQRPERPPPYAPPTPSQLIQCAPILPTSPDLEVFLQLPEQSPALSTLVGVEANVSNNIPSSRPPSYNSSYLHRSPDYPPPS